PAPENRQSSEELAAERERYLRLAADYDNYRKRITRELEQRSQNRKDALLRDLLPALDNLERALNATPGDQFQDGVRMVYDQFMAIMKRHGLEPREDLGLPFDPRF